MSEQDPNGNTKPDQRSAAPPRIRTLGIALLGTVLLLGLTALALGLVDNRATDKPQPSVTAVAQATLDPALAPTLTALAQETPDPALPLLPAPGTITYGAPDSWQFTFVLSGDPNGVGKLTLDAALPVYRLAPPTALDAAAAQNIASTWFGESGAPLDQDTGQPDSPGRIWHWVPQMGAQMYIQAWDGALSWGDGGGLRETVPLDLKVAAADVAQWFSQHPALAATVDQTRLFAIDAQNQAMPELLFRGAVDGYPIYPPRDRGWGVPSNSPGAQLSYSPSTRQVRSIAYTPPRKQIGKQLYPLTTLDAAWAEVLSNPVRHVVYSGFFNGDSSAAFLQWPDPKRDLHIDWKDGDPSPWPLPLSLQLQRVTLGYVYVGDPGAGGPLYLLPVYAFEARGSSPGGREISAVFLAPAVAGQYVPRWVAPRPAVIRVYRRGDQISFAPGTAGYDAIYQASAGLLTGLALNAGVGKNEAQWRQRERDLGVELIYDSAASGGLKFPTDAGPVPADRIFVPLSPAVNPATIWLTSDPNIRYWQPWTTHGGSDELRAVVVGLVDGRQDWGPVPVTATPSPLPLPTAEPTQSGPGIAPTVQLPPAVPTIYPTALPTPTARPTPLAAASAPLRLAAPVRLALNPALAQWEHDAGTAGIDLLTSPLPAPTGDAVLVTTLAHELWLIPTDGGAPQKLTQDMGGYIWAPDGRSIAYSQAGQAFPGFRGLDWSEAGYQWYVVGRDGTGRHMLGGEDHSDGHYDNSGWSAPVAVAVTNAGILAHRYNDLLLVPWDGSKTRVAFSGAGDAATISSDSKHMAYSCPGGLCLRDLGANGEFAGAMTAQSQACSARCMLAWSGDGSLLAVVSRGSDIVGGTDLRLVGGDGSAAGMVPLGGNFRVVTLDGLPGKRFLVGALQSDGASRTLLVDAASKSAWDITPPGLGSSAALLPDKRHLLFATPGGEFWTSELTPAQ